MKSSLRPLALAAMFLFGGCGSVPLTSLVELSRVDVETTDLAALRVAVRLPEAIKPRVDGVTMDAVATVSGEPDQKTTFLLIETGDRAGSAGLPEAARPGFAAYAYRLSTADLARFDALRRAVMQRRREGKRVSLDLGIATKEFCLVRPLPPGPLLTTTYLLTSETRTYVVVTDDLDLRKEQATAELSKLEAC